MSYAYPPENYLQNLGIKESEIWEEIITPYYVVFGACSKPSRLRGRAYALWEKHMSNVTLQDRGVSEIFDQYLYLWGEIIISEKLEKRGLNRPRIIQHRKHTS